MGLKNDLEIPYGKQEYDRLMGLSDEEFNKEFQEELEKAIRADRDLDLAFGGATFGNELREEFGGSNKKMVKDKYNYFKEQRAVRKLENKDSNENYIEDNELENR